MISVGECVLRNFKIFGRWSFTNAARAIVLRAMARAKPSIKFAVRIRWFLAKRYATKMGAHANHHKPFRHFLTTEGRLLDAVLVRLRIFQIGYRHRPRFIDFGLGTTTNKNRFAAPNKAVPTLKTSTP